MTVFDFFNHGFNFVAPAVFMALVLGLGARWRYGAKRHVLPWYGMVLLNAVLGILILALGLVLTGQDGRMATYAVLVLAMGSCQWGMSVAGASPS